MAEFGSGKAIVQREPGDFDALLAAISDGVNALVAWDIAAFQAAVERQSALCEHISIVPASPSTDNADTISKVRELNRVYDGLLRHSIRWTRTLRTILQSGGPSTASQASVHFRG